MRTATSGSLTDRLTREHRMTLDEARLILNVKKEEPMERIMQVRCTVICSLHARFLTGLPNSNMSTCSKPTLLQLHHQNLLLGRSRHRSSGHTTCSPKLCVRVNESKRRRSWPTRRLPRRSRHQRMPRHHPRRQKEGSLHRFDSLSASLDTLELALLCFRCNVPPQFIG